MVSRAQATAAPEAPTAGRKEKKTSSYEDQLFLTRMRRHMKWVFVLLALAFAIGFVAFGVGSGSGNVISDVIGDLFGRNNAVDTKSVADAQQEVEKHPNDPNALKDLADAYRQSHQPKLQAETLEKYLKLRPNDTTALTALAAAYSAAGSQIRGEASTLSGNIPQSFTSDICSFPGTSGLVGAACEDPIDQAIASSGTARVAELLSQSKGLYTKAEDTYRRLAKATPNDPTVLLFLAAAARDAGHQDAQIAAYEEFLRKFPNNENAPDVRRALKQLTQSTDQVVG